MLRAASDSIINDKIIRILTIINHVEMRTIAYLKLSRFQTLRNTCTVAIVLILGVEIFLRENTLSRFFAYIFDAFIIHNILYAYKYLLFRAMMLLIELNWVQQHVRNILFV